MSLVENLIKKETERQKKWIELIASENYPSYSVRKVTSSIFMAKYWEGYPNNNENWSGNTGRYYGGCEVIDELENTCKKEGLKAFWLNEKDWHINVQPHSWSTANQAVLLSILNQWDKILSLDLSNGWHLSHWMKLNLSWVMYDIHHYKTEADWKINYEKVRRRAKEVFPKLIIAGASAYSSEIDFAKFREIADEVGAFLMIDMAHIAWLVVAWLHNSPFDVNADFVTTTTHKTLRWNRGWVIFCKTEFAKQIDRAIFPWLQGWPLMNEIAWKLQMFLEAQTDEFKNYQKRVVENSKTLASEIQKIIEEKNIEGWEIITKWTDNHLFLLSFGANSLMNGKMAEELLGKFHITVNKNLIANDTRNATLTSWIRVGTPAITTRWADEKFMKNLAKIIMEILIKWEEEIQIDEKKISKEIEELVSTLSDIWIDWNNLFTI